MSEMPDLPAPPDVIKENSDANIHILSIGESSIASLGVDSQEDGLTGFLAKQIETNYNNLVSYEVVAKTGYTAAKVNDKLLPQIQSKNADIIMIGLGANDTFKLSKPNKWGKDLANILDSLKKRFGDTPIVFINMPPTTEFPVFDNMLKYFVSKQMLILRNELQKVVSKYAYTYYIPHKLTADRLIKKHNLNGKQISDFYSDGVHPSKLTYRLWAQEIFEFIDMEVSFLFKGLKV